MQSQLEMLIDDLIGEIEPLAKELAESYWEASLTGSDEATQKVSQLETKYRLVFANRTRFERLKQFQKEERISTPQLARQLQLIILESTAEQLSSETIKDLVERQVAIEQVFNTHRATVAGVELNDNAILEILRTDNDCTRRKAAWEGSKQVGRRIASDLITLAHQRNEAACMLGFDNYYEMSLMLHEIEPDFLTNIVDQLEALTKEPFSGVKGEIDRHLSQRFGVAVEDLCPWHYADVFFQEAPDVGNVNLDELLSDLDPVDLTVKFFRGIGLSIEALLERSDLYERPGKSQHAYCIHMNRAGDIRVLANVRPTAKWLETMLHECGHAAYDKHLDSALPFTLRVPAHLITTEAVAMFMGRLGRNAHWLNQMTVLPPGLKQSILAEADAGFRMRTLIFVRWAMVMISFERELYRNPDQNLNALWWDLVERFQLLRRPDGRNEPDWAAKIHIATAPVYYHNYLLGEIVASQLQHTVDCHVLKGTGAADTGYVNEKRIGAYLREKIFKPGSSYHWNDLLVHATGEKLNPQYLVDQLVVD